MIKTIKMLPVIAALLLLLPVMAQAAELDGSQPMLCSIIDVIECAPGGDCLRSNPATVNLPYFVNVDVTGKMLRVPQSSDDTRSTPIQAVTQLDGKLILQGAEHGKEDEEDAVGWTMSIDKDDGLMIFSASREQVGFVIFGACTLP